MDFQSSLDQTAGALNARNSYLGLGLHAFDLGSFSADCPHCGKGIAPVLLLKNPLVIDVGPRRGGIFASGFLLTGKCPACGEAILVAQRFFQLPSGEQVGYLDLVWPRPTRASRIPHGVPGSTRRDYDEARAILNQSPRAAATLARRCLQSILRHKLGIQKRDLFQEIEEALKRDELSRPTRDALHHVREIGNWAAHPVHDQSNCLVDVAREDADYTIDVIELVLNDLYVTPARVAEMNVRIGSRKPVRRSAD